MKNRKILSALFGLLTVSAINPSVVSFKPDFNSDIALMRFTGNENLSLPISFVKTSNSAYKLVFTIYNASTGNSVYTKTYKGSEIGTKLPVRFNINLPIRNRLKSDGLRLEFVHSLSALNTLPVENGVIYPYQKQYINISAHKDEPFVFQGNYLLIKDYKVYTDEQFDFNNLNEYLSVTRDNKLELSNISFKYSSPTEFQSSGVTLNIRDYNNVFPNLKKNGNIISLKMKYTQNEDEINLQLDEQLYVNNDNFDMSTSKLANYTETDAIYIPTNKEDDLLDNDIFITMLDCGYSAVDFTIPFNFYYSKKYIGECYDSDYCIHGGIKE